ncbi:MAG: hypothetical protein U5N86_11320 [Planctomycetota bacterium]|nr:hypothetical protein [Planctomycetota bacterium]
MFGEFQLRSSGYVGYMPIDEELVVRVDPKVDVLNLFRMMEVAYQYDPEIAKGLVDVSSIRELYETLASILCKRILDRARRGLYRQYVSRKRHLDKMKGRILFNDHTEPVRVALPCRYHINTTDILHNMIFLSAVDKIARVGICTSITQAKLRQAYRALISTVSKKEFTHFESLNLEYNRLNSDYEASHALCRFFLENTGPQHGNGDSRNLPFIIDMARLFERFVEKWLEKHLPDNYSVRAQEKCTIGQANDELKFDIKPDLCIYDKAQDGLSIVLDTKYKTSISNHDIYQVLTYAEVRGSKTAVLIYPTYDALERCLQRLKVGNKTLYRLTFDLSRDVQEAGNAFVEDVLAVFAQSR